MDVVLLLSSFAVILAGALAVHQRDRVGRPPARARRGRDRQRARRGRHGDARDADPDRRDHRRRRGLRGRRDRGDHRRAVPARDDRDGARRNLGARLPGPPRAGRAARRRHPDARPRPDLLPRLLRARRSPRGWCCRTPCRSRSRSSSCSPTASMCAQTLRGGGEVQETESIGALYIDRSPGDQPPTGAIVLQLVIGLGAIVGGAHLFVEELVAVAADVRDRAARALACPGPAGDRAAGEGQQLLLGQGRQGQPGARQHHRGDGLPVDDPGRVRARADRVGPRPASRSSREPSGSPAARSPTGRCGSGGGSRRYRSRSGPRCSAPSSRTSRSPERAQAASSSRTWSSCVCGDAFGITCAILPSPSMMKVARATPMYCLPYMLFSTQVP